MKRSRRIFPCLLSALILVGSVALVLADPPYSFTLSTNSTKIVAARGIETATAFATNMVYRQGQYVMYSNRVYMATSAGTSGAIAPVHEIGEASDGVIVWRRCQKTPRNGLVVQLLSSGPVVNLVPGSESAVAGKGISLTAYGGSFCPPSGRGGEPYQGEITAIANTTNVTITTQEW